MKRYFLPAGIIFIISIIAGISLYYKPHKSIQKATADYILTSQELFESFEIDEEGSNEKYLGKVLQITGVIKEISTDDEGLTAITLDGGSMIFGTICKLDLHTEHRRMSFLEGEKVILKGICSGMLMDVVLVRCIEI